MRKKIAFYTLGCKVNQYETQALSEQFADLGFEVVEESEFADVYVINSCTVTGAADRKSRNYARRSKRLNPAAVTALIGCYAQVAEDHLSEMEEIDILLNSAEKDRLPERVLAHFGPGCEPGTEGKTAVTGLRGRTRAYLKIEDGCDRFCTYCIIPYARGPVRSRPMAEILAEAKGLVDSGYREMILTGVNAALYGTDFDTATLQGPGTLKGTGTLTGTGAGIIDVVHRIAALPGDFRIRLGSLEPTVVDADCARQLLSCDRLCPHLHLSLQSGSDAVLKAMGRNYTMADYRAITTVLKAHDPDFSITTDFIVGFPGEEEVDFQASLQAVKDIGFSRIHVFPYSRRAGTAAAAMPNQISEAEKRRRATILAEAGRSAAAAFLTQNKGRTRQILLLERDGDGDRYEGITDNDITVCLAGDECLPNRFYDKEI
jgi:threonylcarbamoyladenosine tRNA methylthiotransferase MtaB